MNAERRRAEVAVEHRIEVLDADPADVMARPFIENRDHERAEIVRIHCSRRYLVALLPVENAADLALPRFSPPVFGNCRIRGRHPFDDGDELHEGCAEIISKVAIDFKGVCGVRSVDGA